MTTEPKNPKPPVDKHGNVIPPEKFENDQRCPPDAEVDTGPGSVYADLMQRDKESKSKK